MTDEIIMLREILKQSGWSQEQLAGKLGVSFATVNSWLNGKSKPREIVKKRIKDLYLAKDVGYEDDPVFITINRPSDDMRVGDYVLLEKDSENYYDGEAIIAHLVGIDADEYILGDISYVANSVSTVARGTWSAGRIYDKLNGLGKAKILFILKKSAIAEVVDWEASA